MASIPIVITDFDGTLTNIDVGDALCELYADPSWIEIDRRFVRGELSLPEAQRQMWSLVRAPIAELRARALEIASLRAGADALFTAAEAGRIELVIASGGFDFYIEALLGPRMQHLHAAYYNRAVASALGIELTFPHTDLFCDRCAVCKGKAVHLHTDNTRRVLFCGDGTSDRCAAVAGTELFTIQGSTLARHCDARGIQHTEFEDFADVLAAL
jgi:2-hydroxy-3-keto-5-methylthiopentenyl-1-phosphate phosphatase